MKAVFKIFFVLLITSPLLFLPGCGGVHLSQQIVTGADDWLMSGGVPQQLNVAKSVLEPPLEVVWSYNIDAGIGVSAISVSDGVVFINDLQGEMYAIDIGTGGKIGQINFLGKEASSTPLLDGNNVYVTFAGDKKYSIACYNMLEGDVKWRRNLGDIQTSPVMKDDFIYTGSLIGKFYKISKSGRVEWKFNASSPIHSTCAIEENKTVFGADNGYIYCVDLNTGLEAWKFKTGESVITTPLVYNNKVFMGSYDSNYYCIDINSGSKVWSANLKTKLVTGSALFGDSTVIFGGVDGILYCLNISDGSQKWTLKTEGVITSTPLCSGKYVYFTSYDRKVYCAEGNSGKVLWNYELDDKGKTSPVIWRNMMFTADDVNIICFSPKKNAE